MDLIITILPVVTKDLPISPRFTPYNFLSRCKFSTLTTRQPMVEWDREILFFPDQLTTSRIGNLTRLIHTLAICDDHTYIHTYKPNRGGWTDDKGRRIFPTNQGGLVS